MWLREIHPEMQLEFMYPIGVHYPNLLMGQASQKQWEMVSEGHHCSGQLGTTAGSSRAVLRFPHARRQFWLA